MPRAHRAHVKDECVSLKEPEHSICGVRSFGGMFSQLVRSRRPKEDPHTHETVRDVTLQEATESTTGQEKRSGTRWSRRSRSGGVHEARRDCTPRTRPERDAKKAKEEVVKNVTESMDECDQYERVLRCEQQQGRCSAKLQSEKQVT